MKLNPLKIARSVFTILLFTAISCTSKYHTDIPKLYARTNDYADILSPEEEAELNQLLKSLEDSIGSQLAVLTIDTLPDEAIEVYSLKVAESWAIGRAGYNDGVLITVAMREKTVRIEVGYGLELIIRDEIAKRIIDSTMIPEFRSGDFYKGLSNGSKEIIELIYNNPYLVGEEWKTSKTKQTTD